MLTPRPGDQLHPDPAILALHTAHGVEQKYTISPQRDKLKAPLVQAIVQRGRPGASRADRLAVLSGNNDNFQERLAFFSYKTHFVVYEGLEFIALIEDSLDTHLLSLFW
jgi:hypothetical protein